MKNHPATEAVEAIIGPHLPRYPADLKDAGFAIVPHASAVDTGTAQLAIETALAALGVPLACGAHVKKTGTGYGGPGRVCGVAIAEDGSPRVIVAHKIEGGHGRLIHIYSKAHINAGGENGD